MFDKLNPIIKWMIGNNAITTISVIITTIIFPINIILIKNDQNKTISYISNVVGFIIALVTIMLLIVKAQYTVVPYVYDISGESAKIRITDASLKYDKHDFIEDDDKYVVSMIPDAGTVVRKNTTVRVIMVNKHSDLALSGILDDYENNSEKIDNMILYGLNTKHIELVVNDIGAYISTEKEENVRDIGHLKLENSKVELIDYTTNQPVMIEYSNKYGLVNFYNLNPGVYYFRASCDGYETTTTSDFPFKIVSDDRYEDNPGTWRISLKRENQQFSNNELRIKIVDAKNKPIINEEFQARVFHKEYERTAYHSIILVSDDNGYLSLRSYDIINNTTTMKLEPITIKLGIDYELEIHYNDLSTLVEEVLSDELVICFEE